MSDFNAVDLWFTESGDIAIDDNGDLKDTSPVYGRSLIQEIRTRLKAHTGDWLLYKTIGANLEDYLGESSTDRHIGRVIRAITGSLTYDRLLLPNEIEITPLKLNDSTVLFRLIVKTLEGDIGVDLAYDSDHKRFLGL